MSDTPFRGTTVAFNQYALTIIGVSGSGKSSLALQMMSLGCRLVSDDYTVLKKSGDALIASAPSSIKGKIEVHGIGILAAKTIDEAKVIGIIDLDLTETQRLPLLCYKTIDGIAIRLFHKIEGCHFPAALLQYIKSYGDNQDHM
ncbi:HPr kinase/phosphorylase [Parasulfitobacter algicola]|uniref:Serine kinase n=1 Tax=Parasulfitobacter algicola TaxID=2614809 RepID=A0ABX2INM7_9RHOB|nr:serine kinase [Sulfitobacter algicola]NSX54496.1 serine kinase [Sulfitobacter algicola]